MSSGENEFVKKMREQVNTEETNLLQIQKEIKKAKYDREKVFNLIKNLSPMQRKKLKEMYIVQNKKLKYSLLEYKNKILTIKNNKKI